MNIVFYSTNTNDFDGSHLAVQTFPSRRSEWDAVARAFPQVPLIVFTQLPGTFLLDVQKNQLAEQSSQVQYVLTQTTGAESLAREILALKPDIAIAATYWVTPFDWLPVQDAHIGELLRAHGVRTLCHPLNTALRCFDKYQTRLFLAQHGFAVPRAVYINHEQFWSERRHRGIRTNAYKEAVLAQLQTLRYPVVIKDTVGLSSYGMEVAVSYKQALFYLFSGRTNSDRLVEEYIAGTQCGAEVYGADGSYTVLPPFLFSVNRYGITSPKQSIKIGPVTGGDYHLAELNEQLQSLARLLQFSGIAQVDLIFSEGRWYIVEVNPRISGMTETYAVSLGQPLYATLLQLALSQHPDFSRLDYALNIKLPILAHSQLKSLSAAEGVGYVHQIHNEAAKQDREKGYCEIVLHSNESVSALIALLTKLDQTYPGIVEPKFLDDSKKCANILKYS